MDASDKFRKKNSHFVSFFSRNVLKKLTRLVLKIARSYIVRHSVCVTFCCFTLDLLSVFLSTSLDLRQEASALFLVPTADTRRVARS